MPGLSDSGPCWQPGRTRCQRAAGARAAGADRTRCQGQPGPARGAWSGAADLSRARGGMVAACQGSQGQRRTRCQGQPGPARGAWSGAADLSRARGGMVAACQGSQGQPGPAKGSMVGGSGGSRCQGGPGWQPGARASQRRTRLAYQYGPGARADPAGLCGLGPGWPMRNV